MACAIKLQNWMNEMIVSIAMNELSDEIEQAIPENSSTGGAGGSRVSKSQ